MSILAGKFAVLGSVLKVGMKNPTGYSRALVRHRAITMTALASILSKGSGVLVTLISVPLTLDYLGPERFGMWMTLSSFVMLLSLTDFGVGNSLLTAVAQESGKKSRFNLRGQISSAYAVTSGVAFLMLVVLVTIHDFIPWATLFNVSTPVAMAEANAASVVFFIILAVLTPVGLINRVQFGLQQGFRSSLWQTFGNLAALAAIILAAHSKVSLPWLIAAQAGVPAVVAIVNTLDFFIRLRPDLRPTISRLERSIMRQLSTTGLLFVVLQVSAAIMFQSNAIIIAQVLNAEAVATYTVAERMFGLVGLLLSLLMMPLWPAYGEALTSGDLDWVKTTFKRSVFFSFVLSAMLSSILVLLGPTLIQLWVGDVVVVPFMLILGLGVWKIIEAVGNAAAMLLNGLNEIGVQALLAVLNAVASIAAKIWLVDRFGLPGVMLATIGAYSIFALPWLGLMVQTALRRIEERQRLRLDSVL
ncbi:MAG: lipopolysaccharide biosynthesis protein [Rhizobiaceae bacterium]